MPSPMQPIAHPGGIEVTVAPVRRRGQGVALLFALRPKQWLKNLIVLAPLVFSRELASLGATGAALGAFAVFCGLASGVYLFNDLRDVEADRKHPRKRFRPLPAGELSPAVAVAAGVFLLSGSLLAALALEPVLALIGALYLAVNVAYTLVLKRVVLLDVFAVSSGFVLRATAGGVVVGVIISPWLFLCTLFLSLFLALGKRRHELVTVENAHEHRLSLAGYSTLFIDQMVGILAAITVATYALYTVADVTVERFGTENLIYTVPFVLYGIFRYLFLIYQRNGGDRPEHSLITDGALLATVGLWVAAVVVIIYVV